MAGRARHEALKAEMERRTRDLFEDEPEKNHLDFVAEWLEAGRTGVELCSDLEKLFGWEFSYARLKNYLYHEFGSETVDPRLDQARERSAEPFAEKAMQLVDEKAETNVDVSRALARAKTRQWLAERYNPRRFGQNKGVAVTVNVGQLHLTAMREASSERLNGATPTSPFATGARARIIEAYRNDTVEHAEMAEIVTLDVASEGDNTEHNTQHVDAQPVTRL